MLPQGEIKATRSCTFNVAMENSLVTLNSRWLFNMNVITIYDWFAYVITKTRLVVGCFKVELLRYLSFLYSLLYEEGAWVVITVIMWIARPCVAY